MARLRAPGPGRRLSLIERIKHVQRRTRAASARAAGNAGLDLLKMLRTPNTKKTKYTFMYRSADGHLMRPESFLNINKGRTLSSSQLRILGITKIKLKDACNITYAKH
jgi:hypothetical protein